MKRTRRLLLGALLALAGVGTLAGFSQLREDEIECEQAVAHLEECCPDLTPRKVECVYAEGCGTTTQPALSLGESRCLQEIGCAEIRAQGLCDAVESLDPTFIDQDGGVDGHSPEVCP